MTSNLPELIAAVEGLEAPSRKIDLCIACALDRRPEWLAQSQGHMWVDASGLHPVIRWADDRTGRSSGNPSVDDPPPFTASIDAAMTLVPEVWRIGDISQHDHEILRAKGDWTAWLYPDGKLEPVTGDKPRCRFASSAPLALTAAALRARLEGEGSGL